MVPPGTKEKVEFLRRPEVYPNGVRSVEVRQTHMSWLFFTETRVWKLKKPVCSEYFDFRSLESRRTNSEQEVRINRRLAPDVYLGVTPLTFDKGTLALDGQGEPVDWLVKMRRLPGNRMLDQAIADRTWRPEELRDVGILLGRFYRTATVVRMSGNEYRRRLARVLSETAVELENLRYGLPAPLLKQVSATALRFIEQRPSLLDARANSGKIVDAHGDLRPEHVCLESHPVIIDCLEFNRSLRILDSASELSFFKMECERLGSSESGNIVLNACASETGDSPPEPLLQFYRNYHACIRAKLAVWHLRDSERCDSPKWLARARTYLEMTAGKL